MNIEMIKEILVDQKIPQEKILIKRQTFDLLTSMMSNKQVLVISGIRRCGKSTLLHQLCNKYFGYYCNFDDDRLIPFKSDDFQKLYEALIELYGNHDIFYFDEIQNISGWERFVRRLHDSGKKIVLTGSNANMLSRELGTHLTGRYLELNLYPFSFKEYLTYQKCDPAVPLTSENKANLRRWLNRYIQEGGMPEFVESRQREYLKMLVENIVYRDVMVRYDLSNERAIQELIYYIASNVGKATSFSALTKVIGVKNATSVKDYFSYLENCFLIFLITKFDYSLKRQLYANKKPYFIDTGLANHFGFRFSPDKGRLLENIVYLQLKRDKKEVYYFREKNECDFVTDTDVIQVCYELNSQNQQREINGLLQACQYFDQRSATLITFDQDNELTENGISIKVAPVWKWLLDI